MVLGCLFSLDSFHFGFEQDPIDLQTMRDRLEAGGFYKSHAMLQADMLRMCVNCKTYNAEGTAYFQAAVDIEAVIGEAFQNVPKV